MDENKLQIIYKGKVKDLKKFLKENGDMTISEFLLEQGEVDK